MLNIFSCLWAICMSSWRSVCSVYVFKWSTPSTTWEQGMGDKCCCAGRWGMEFDGVTFVLFLLLTAGTWVSDWSLNKGGKMPHQGLIVAGLQVSGRLRVAICPPHLPCHPPPSRGVCGGSQAASACVTWGVLCQRSIQDSTLMLPLWSVDPQHWHHQRFVRNSEPQVLSLLYPLNHVCILTRALGWRCAEWAEHCQVGHRNDPNMHVWLEAVWQGGRPDICPCSSFVVHREPMGWKPGSLPLTHHSFLIYMCPFLGSSERKVNSVKDDGLWWKSCAPSTWNNSEVAGISRNNKIKFSAAEMTQKGNWVLVGEWAWVGTTQSISVA